MATLVVGKRMRNDHQSLKIYKSGGARIRTAADNFTSFSKIDYYLVQYLIDNVYEVKTGEEMES